MVGSILLEPLSEDTLEFVRQVRSDPEVYRWLFTQKPISKEEQQEWWRQYQAQRSVRLYVASCNGEPIGYGQLKCGTRKGELGVCVRQQGMGEPLVRAMIQEAWGLGLTWLWVYLFADNTRALVLYLKCGFDILPVDLAPRQRGGGLFPTRILVLPRGE